MELVLWHLQDGMVSKSGFCWRTHWNIRNETLEIWWTNPAAIKMNSSTVLCVAGYGACDVAYLLWDQIATNVVEERVEGLPIRSNALLTCGKHQSTCWQWQNCSTRFSWCVQKSTYLVVWQSILRSSKRTNTRTCQCSEIPSWHQELVNFYYSLLQERLPASSVYSRDILQQHFDLCVMDFMRHSAREDILIGHTDVKHPILSL